MGTGLPWGHDERTIRHGCRRRAPCPLRSAHCGSPSSTSCSRRRCAVSSGWPHSPAVAAGPGRRARGPRPSRPGGWVLLGFYLHLRPGREQRAGRRRGPSHVRKHPGRARAACCRKDALVSGLRSSQVAAAAGVNQQTLRYYQRRGLLAEPERSPGGQPALPGRGGHRAAGHQGCAAARIYARRGHRPAQGRHRHSRPDAGLQARAQAKLAEVEAKITDLQAITDTLRAAVQGCGYDLVTCAGSRPTPIPLDAIAGGPDTAAC